MSKTDTIPNKADNGVIGNEHIQALVFAVGDKSFAMDITRCRDVSKPTFITSVPKSKTYISGIVNIRGEIITVFELTRLLSYPDSENTSESVVIRVKTPAMVEAFRADAITDTVTVPRTDLEDASYHLSEHETQFISFVTVLNGRMVLFIDVERVFDHLS